MDQQAEIAGRVVLLAPVPQELDLELAFVEGGLGLLAELGELLVQAVEQRGLGHLTSPDGLADHLAGRTARRRRPARCCKDKAKKGGDRRRLPFPYVRDDRRSARGG